VINNYIMMRLVVSLLLLLGTTLATKDTNEKQVLACPLVLPQTECVSFQITSGTGCQWMCEYCANNLGTSNYYFTDEVCTYESGGCVGNPMTDKTYTCCAN
jgi:hypothetical protein